MKAMIDLSGDVIGRAEVLLARGPVLFDPRSNEVGNCRFDAMDGDSGDHTH